MNKRNSGIDLLRCLLALMVITLHYNASLGQVQVNTIDLSFNWFFVWLTETVSFCAVNVYVIITGYYSYLGRKELPSILSKLRSLWFCVLFYSVVGYVIITLLVGKEFHFSELFKRFLPISTGEWWFFSLYFIVYFMSPFINKILDGMKNNTIMLVGTAGVVVLCVIPQLLLWDDGLGIDNGYSLIWFLFLFFTGAVIAKHSLRQLEGRPKEIIDLIEKYRIHLYLASLGILYGSKIVIALVSNHLWGEVKYSGLLFSYNSIFVYVAATTMFLIFKGMSLNRSSIIKIVECISPLALASYLFHCQIDFREEIWPRLECYSYANKAALPVAYLTTVFSLFTISVLIELIRTKVIKIVIKKRN